VFIHYAVLTANMSTDQQYL